MCPRQPRACSNPRNVRRLGATELPYRFRDGDLGVSVKQRIVICLLAAAPAVYADEFRLETAGARFGFSPAQKARDFHQAEGFLNFYLPWSWDLGARWNLASRLDLSAGWLGDPYTDAFVGTLGPSLILHRAGLPFSLEIGASPTVLSEDKFALRDFGVRFQFTSHIGLNWDLGSHFRIGYRFQHMSNAHISSHNDGLNLHMVAASYLF